MNEAAPSLTHLNEQQLRELAQALMLKTEKLSHELAILRRLRYGRISEQLDAAQGKLFEEDHAWLVAQRSTTHDALAIAKAIGDSLNRWAALTRYLDDGRAPIDNNHAENLIRPIALGRKNWLLAGSLRAGQRAAANEPDPVSAPQRA